jgi:hypothetical protein
MPAGVKLGWRTVAPVASVTTARGCSCTANSRAYGECGPESAPEAGPNFVIFNHTFFRAGQEAAVDKVSGFWSMRQEPRNVGQTSCGGRNDGSFPQLAWKCRQKTSSYIKECKAGREIWNSRYKASKCM